MICLDASFIGLILSPDEEGDQAMELFAQFKHERKSLIAPSLLTYEIGSILTKKLRRKIIDHADFMAAIDKFHRMGIKLIDSHNFLEQLAPLIDAFPSLFVYDLSYLVIAKAHRARLFTADKKFYRALHDTYPQVQLI